MKCLSLLGLVIFLPSLLPALVLAQVAPAVPNWSDGEPSQEVAGLQVRMGGPVIGDVDGNQSNGNEIALAGANGKVTVLRSDGTTLWQQDVSRLYRRTSGCAKASQLINSAPAVGALFGDGIPYVVVGFGAVASGCDGGVVALRGVDGSVRWRFSTRSYARQERFVERFGAVFGAPALADTDGDGTLEIGFTSLDRSVYLLNANGSMRWSYQAADTVFSSPAFADVNGDGRLELIVGTDISGNKRINPPTADGGILYAFYTQAVSYRSAGRASRRIGFRNAKSFVWSLPLDQVLQSSPAVADLIPDEPGLEIAIGSGCFFPQTSRDKRGKWIKIVSGASGRVLRTLAAPACSTASPAVGDINGDGSLEVVSIADGREQVGGDGRVRVIAWDPRTGEELWSVAPIFKGRGDMLSAYFMSPVVGDVDGNGSLEVVLALNNSVAILRGTDGAMLTCGAAWCDEATVALGTRGRLLSSPALGDLNGDGKTDIVAATGSQVYSWSLTAPLPDGEVGPHPPYALPWSHFRGGSRRSGLLEEF